MFDILLDEEMEKDKREKVWRFCNLKKKWGIIELPLDASAVLSTSFQLPSSFMSRPPTT